MYNCEAKDGSTGGKAIITHVEGQKLGYKAWRTQAAGRWESGSSRGGAGLGRLMGLQAWGWVMGPNHNIQSITESDSQLPRQIHTYAFVGKLRQISSISKVIHIKLFVDLKKRI